MNPLGPSAVLCHVVLVKKKIFHRHSIMHSSRNILGTSIQNPKMLGIVFWRSNHWSMSQRKWQWYSPPALCPCDPSYTPHQERSNMPHPQAVRKKGRQTWVLSGHSEFNNRIACWSHWVSNPQPRHRWQVSSSMRVFGSLQKYRSRLGWSGLPERLAPRSRYYSLENKLV